MSNTDVPMKEYKGITMEEISKLPIAFLPERKIRKDVYQYFNVRMATSPQDGKTPTDIYFPAYDQQGKITGWKRRDLTKDKSEKFHFTTIGKVGTNSKLFGQQQSEALPQRKKRMVFVEGEFDVMSAFQAMVDSVSQTKYKDMKPHVVGLNCGTANAVESTLYNKSYVDQFEELLLAFDADSALEMSSKSEVRGEEATEAVATCLLKDNIFVANYTHPHKDPNDYIVGGASEELAKLLQFSKVPFCAEKIISSRDISFEEFTEPAEEGTYIKCFPKLMDKLHGIRKGELIVLTSPSGVGKSSITSEIAFELANQGFTMGMMYLEETGKQTLQRMGARYTKTKYNDFKANPRKGNTDELLKEAHNWTQDKFYFLDHFGSIPLTELMNKIKSFVYINKTDFIIIDHLSMVISGLNITDERKMLDMVMTELAAFCASNDVGIIAVSHLNRGIVENFKRPKGLGENESFWVEVTKEMMRGSASLEQLAWTVIGLEPEILPDRSRGRCRLVALKNRTWAYMGVADVIQMNDTTGLFEACDY